MRVIGGRVGRTASRWGRYVTGLSLDPMEAVAGELRAGLADRAMPVSAVRGDREGSGQAHAWQRCRAGAFATLGTRATSR